MHGCAGQLDDVLLYNCGAGALMTEPCRTYLARHGRKLASITACYDRSRINDLTAATFGFHAYVMMQMSLDV